ncbi:S1C family serine protease [Bradyrhizobium sp.]|uniref:S1C family serine protease n=1 Tax=Bradyrhizobium sp. TaxID=376 RepID=UPI003C728B57
MSDPAAVSLSSLSSAIAGVVAQITPAIVSVHSHRSRASGFVWKSGLVVTADETLADEGEVSVRLASGEVVPATIAGRDHTTDIALLRLDTRTAAAVHLTREVPVLGSLSVVVAADRGTPTAALGLVSLVGERWRSLRGGEIDSRIELDVRMRHNHQGGLALDAAGKAIGMAVLGVRRVIVIPAATIDRVAGKLESHGRIARGYLGVGLQPVKLDNEGIGAMVMSVDSAGPSAAAGLRQGDVIVSWNGEKLAGVRTLLRRLGPESVGSIAEVAVRRAGEPALFKLTIGERPEA